MNTADSLVFLSAVELRRLFTQRQLSPVEVVRAVIERIERLNPALNAFVTSTPELARAAAERAERAYADGPDQVPLLGIPFSVKDTIQTQGVRTTMGSLLLESWIPNFDAPSVERCRAAGGALVGKTNTAEFGWKGDSGNRVVGPTYNPWAAALTAGGSSGGAAAAVATGLGAIALATDAAGSTRIPAAFCGVFGLKSSFGLIPVAPRGGVETLPHVGIITRTVADAALALSVAAGPDARDRLSLPLLGVDYARAAEGDIGGLRVAWSPTLGFARIEPEILAAVTEAVRSFAELGCDIEEVNPKLDDPYQTLYVLLAAGSAGAHRDTFSEVRDQLDADRLPMLEDAFRLTAADVGAALVQRAQWVERMRVLLEPFDLLLTPTVPVRPFAAGLEGPVGVAGKPRPGLSWSPFTYPVNLTGQPAASVPCGFTADGLPVGLQLVGRLRDDVTVLRAAAAFEAARPWRDVRPPSADAESAAAIDT